MNLGNITLKNEEGTICQYGMFKKVDLENTIFEFIYYILYFNLYKGATDIRFDDNSHNNSSRYRRRIILIYVKL